MENLAKAVRGSLIFVGVLAIVCGTYGFYKYKNMVSEIQHLHEYIDNYVNKHGDILAEKDRLISEYKVKIQQLEKMIEELKKKKDGKWWWDRDRNGLNFSSINRWWNTGKTSEELLLFYSENMKEMESWYELNSDIVKERLELDNVDLESLTVGDIIEIYISRDKL
jgi:hypothetical protein